MPRAKVTHHPCHNLSVPSAKRFWCRHCMQVFGDAITRWRHSRTCRSESFDSYGRRREVDTYALQKMAETLDPEMQTVVAAPGASCSTELRCFICRRHFLSIDDMREHVRYPCNKPAFVAPQQSSVTVYIEEPTFGTGITQRYTDQQPVQDCISLPMDHDAVDNSGPATVYIEGPDHTEMGDEVKPTNIYVNENGETVIEVENLDVNTKRGELSLAHLLTQLSEQGIVFHRRAQGSETEESDQTVVVDVVHEAEHRQPTVVDAANTLTQLAGSVLRSSGIQQQELCSYSLSRNCAKSESTEDVNANEGYVDMGTVSGDIAGTASHAFGARNDDQIVNGSGFYGNEEITVIFEDGSGADDQVVEVHCPQTGSSSCDDQEPPVIVLQEDQQRRVGMVCQGDAGCSRDMIVMHGFDHAQSARSVRRESVRYMLHGHGHHHCDQDHQFSAAVVVECVDNEVTLSSLTPSLHPAVNSTHHLSVDGSLAPAEPASGFIGEERTSTDVAGPWAVTGHDVCDV